MKSASGFLWVNIAVFSVFLIGVPQAFCQEKVPWVILIYISS